jgi:cyclopropane-fatty-acyl-phospholipid synthase
VPRGTPVAARLAALVQRFLGAPLPLRIRAWDGSEAGGEHAEPNGPVVIIRNRRALRHVLWNPNELGLARAYVSGDLDVDGELYDGLARFWRFAREQRLSAPSLSLRDRVEMLRAAIGLGVIGPRPPAPPEEARLSGEKHSRSRDLAAISYHYDLSNDFYAKLLDKSMAYSCGYWTAEPGSHTEHGAGYSVADAQRDKLDLICRKLELRPGMRLLDVGCGWGSLILYAAEHYGVQATGITISASQRACIRQRAEQIGLSGSVEARLADYRELADEPFDAIGTIEMGEHVGAENYPTYMATLHRMLKPGGKLLLQQMSRGAVAPGGGAFIESYVAPDMTMVPVGQTVDAIERTGLEVRDVHALREHYVTTVRAWADTLEAHWSEFVAMVGEGEARVWRLYLAGGALTFAENRMGVNQILAVRPTEDGTSGMPRTRVDDMAPVRSAV